MRIPCPDTTHRDRAVDVTYNLRDAIYGCPLLVHGFPVLQFWGRAAGRARVVRVETTAHLVSAVQAEDPAQEPPATFFGCEEPLSLCAPQHVNGP